VEWEEYKGKGKVSQKGNFACGILSSNN